MYYVTSILGSFHPQQIPTMPVVQFAPFASLVQPGFWHELTKLKIDVLRLSDESVTANGSYTIGRSIRDRETGQDIALGCNLVLGTDAFEKAPKYVTIAGDIESTHTWTGYLPCLYQRVACSRTTTRSRNSRPPTRQPCSTKLPTRCVRHLR